MPVDLERLQSESAVAKGDPTKPSIAVQSAISSKREDTVQISLAKHHSEKSCTVELPAKKTDPTIAENIRADKSTEKWKRKFCKLRFPAHIYYSSYRFDLCYTIIFNDQQSMEIIS